MNEKLTSFLSITGTNKQDSKQIRKEKSRYVLHKLLWLLKIGKKNNYSMGQGLKNPVIVKSKGLFYCREKCLDFHIISDSYEFKVKKVFENLAKESKIIVDIGANIGRYTVLGGISNPKAKIYSIEPEKVNFDILSKTVKLNNLNVELMRMALGSKEGTAKLYGTSDSINYGGFSLKNETDNFDLVQLQTFDNLFKDKEIDLVKIDVEGFELEVLLGMKSCLSKQSVKNLVIEIDKENYDEIISLFNKYGYSAKLIMYNNYLVSVDKEIKIEEQKDI